MFKKLKEKITEEVKSSPQRFQQLTQTVSDRLQNSSTSDENFYSIAEDDAKSADHGFSSVNLVSPTETRFRRNSSSSVASDVSFLPRYEAGSMYQLQSDLDMSASEMEDNASTSSQLGHLSKEQIFSAFQKAQMGYHKYRGRYTDLARHYKELERENGKMKSVLVETQDKAIRRVSELKEQCASEQKAKAQLQSKIENLQTKIHELQNGSADTLIELHNSDEKTPENSPESLMKCLNEARREIEVLNERIQEQKAVTIVFQSKENDYRNKIANLEKQISNFCDLEKESNLKLAEAKMDLHNELISKDNEITRLKKDLETYRNQTESSNGSSKLENLQIQNKKLIDRIESLTQKNNNLDSELLKVEKYKVEIQTLKEENTKLRKNLDNLKIGIEGCKGNLKQLSDEKIALIESIVSDKREYETQLENLRDSAKKALISLESKIRDKTLKEYSEKEEKLKQEFTEKIKEITTNNHSAKEIQIKLLEKEDELRKISSQLRTVEEKLKNRDDEYKNLEKIHLELIEEGNQLRIDLEKSKNELQKLHFTTDHLHDKIDELEQLTKQKEEENINLSLEIMKLENHNKEIMQKLRIFEEKAEMIELESNECRLLELKLQKIEEEKKFLLESFENERKMFNDMLEDNKELKLKEEEIVTLKQSIKNMEKHIVHLNEELQRKEDDVVNLGKTKHDLEQEVTKLKELVRIAEEKEEAVELDKTECNLLQIKVRKLEDEMENLLKSFEMERKTFDDQFRKHKIELSDKAENIKEEKERENLELVQENLKLKKTNEEINMKLRVLEERHELIELEKNESKLLELKIEKLNEEKKGLLEEFEMERKMFNELLENNKELKLKEEKIYVLSDSNRSLEQKVCSLNELIKKLENDNVELQKIKLNLEKESSKLNERIRILEEKEETLEVDRNECALLQMKLQALENEKENILKSFELERKNFQEAFDKIANYEERIHNLHSEVDSLTLKLKQENDKHQKATNDNQTNLKKIHDLTNRIQSLTQHNETLKKEAENKETQMRELSKTIDKLSLDIDKQSSEFNRLLERSKMLDEVVVKIQNESAENLKKEKERQNEVNLKLKELENELELKKNELVELNSKFAELEKQNDELKTKLGQLENLEESIKLAGNEKQAIEEELMRLKVVEAELKKRTSDFKVVTEEKKLAEQEKDEALKDVINLRENLKKAQEENNNLEISLQKLREFEQGSVNLKNQNEILQNDAEKFRQEISELNVRISQLSRDNKIISEENQALISNLEELKIKLELLEGEPIEKNKFEQEKLELITEVEQLRKKCAERDLEKIQQDFYEIKEKCDSLFVENKSLKEEYSKLEEKCDGFSKVKNNLETQVRELENQYSEIQNEKQLLLDEIQELKIPQIVLKNNSEGFKQEKTFEDQYIKEITVLRDKLTQYKSLDITNKSSIEFYEGELQKMKNKNEKLNRQLDETLVTLNHCAELSNSTEIEYLRNVLYNYMLGKESIVLARVIAAVCKFDPQQTDAVLQREQQKQTLLGQLGLI